MLPPDYEQIGASVAQMCDIRASRAKFKLYNYDEALKVDPLVGKWIQFSQTAALGSHPYVLGNGPELPKVPGPHTDLVGEALKGMYAEGCTSLRDARIITRTGQSGMVAYHW
jgi:hypothetical protein